MYLIYYCFIVYCELHVYSDIIKHAIRDDCELHVYSDIIKQVNIVRLSP